MTWDGRIHQVGENSPHGVDGIDTAAAPEAPPLLSPGAWEALELELGRDSELRLLIVVMRVSLACIMGEDHGMQGGWKELDFGMGQLVRQELTGTSWVPT